MPDRGAEAGVETGFQSRDPRIDLRAERLVECLADIDEDTVAAHGGESIERDLIAASVEASRQRFERLAGDGNHGSAVHGAFCRPRHVEQNGDGEIALLIARVAVQAIVYRAACPPVGKSAHDFV